MTFDARTKPYADEDMDSLHILPLAVMPLQTRALQSANLVKNSRLCSVVELFAGAQTGSGQIEIADLGQQFEVLSDSQHPDLKLLKKLGQLRSYDVYSLRITLREAGVPVPENSTLKLSRAKEAELTDFTRRFTRQLLRQTFAPVSQFGDDDGIETIVVEHDDAAVNLSRLIFPSDPKVAYESLASFAHLLDIKLSELPLFIEDFADIHLSVAYYESCYNDVVKSFDEFAALVSHWNKTNRSFRENEVLQQKCARVVAAMTKAKAFLGEQLKSFDVQTQDFWENISAARFREIQTTVKNNHVRLGSILCGMTVKMNAWTKKFPSPNMATAERAADCIMYELAEGVGLILAATSSEENAPQRRAA